MPKVIFLIFLVAVLIRFLYFPGNINFAYDQARDSFTSIEVLKGDLKILGPPTTISDKVFHGAIFYYILAPIYLLSNNNPEVAAAVFRVINALGVFLTFYIASWIFNWEIGLIAALLYAVSFEQSQYSIFFGHPALGVLPVLFFYLGLVLWFFKAKPIGFVIALAGLGLTLQFEDVNILLVLNFFAYLILFHKNLKLLNFKNFLLGILILLLAVSNFILAEIKYQFRMSKVVISSISNPNTESVDLSHFLIIIKRFINDNLLANQNLGELLLILISLGILMMINKKDLRKKAIFLSIWFIGGLIPHFLSSSFSYQYSPGATVALLILISFFIYQIFSKNRILSITLVAVIIFSNLTLITSQNIKGPGSDIIIQPGMLTFQQRKVLDYIYEKADQKPFAVNALTIPLNVKTTWDYLFNWYGKEKYGYLPVWGGEAADGFKGSLVVIRDRSKLPNKRFTIIEPTIGIGQGQVEDFFRIENYFSKVVEEKQFGTITVQERERIL